jgi:DNA-binding Lrp family transcriptional regulator
MVTAIILFEIKRGRVNEVGERLADIKGITEVYSVGGRYDLVAIARLSDNEELSDLVNRQLAQEDGVERTESLIAFRMFSRHDLESMFSIGFK